MRAPQSSSLARSRRPSSHGGASPNSSPLRGSIAMVRKSSKAFARTDPSSPTSPPSIAARRGSLGMPQCAGRRDLCRRRLQGWHTLTTRRAPSLGAEEDMTAAGGRGGAPPPKSYPCPGPPSPPKKRGRGEGKVLYRGELLPVTESRGVRAPQLSSPAPSRRPRHTEVPRQGMLQLCGRGPP
jgi:hypothetical protein